MFGRFVDKETGEEHGFFEVFYMVNAESEGWFWWACEPGCLPDQEPAGPFDTADEAYTDAREGAQTCRTL